MAGPQDTRSLWDTDGNHYIDFLQAGGPTVLGSNYAPVREKVFEMLHTCGLVTGLFHECELKLAQLVIRFMPAVEMFRVLGSGTEGVMAVIRAAHAFTKQKYVIKVGGTYHGWRDQMVYRLHVPARVDSMQQESRAAQAGQPRNFSRTVWRP